MGYKIVHSNTAQLKQKVDRALNAFTKQLKGEASRMFRTFGETQLDVKEDLAAKSERLLALRKKMVEYIKQGMYERKDMEVEIAWLAMLIWVHRMDAEKAARILEEW